jgi:hypothetical protein
MGCRPEESAYPHISIGEFIGFKRAILPLEIVFRGGDKGKHVLERTVDLYSKA